MGRSGSLNRTVLDRTVGCGPDSLGNHCRKTLGQSGLGGLEEASPSTPIKPAMPLEENTLGVEPGVCWSCTHCLC